ncbi:hypothetical protein H2198_001423 [Neophaeococcomyces mojaviensis]|uniref:Uncharacterized protein n=1 Tax=Neophaeococcomyces mojaviensis TaxID=3383035 RepID=A0ACC3AGX2_9EURO|nr:hypothetical protein H2198_001423 [Knufia sp. JES_112]
MAALTSTSSVLLLPVSTLPLPRGQLKAQYGPTLEAALRHAKPNDQSISRFDIAIILKDAVTSRSTLFDSLQHLLADVYTLICLIAAQHKVELDFPSGVDARVFLINLSADDKDVSPLTGPLVSVAALAASRRQYAHWRAPESLHSSDYSRRLQQLGESVKSLPEGHASAVLSDQPQASPAPDRQATRLHHRVAVGGTFDHIHIGHKLLLTATIFIAQPGEDREITIGITGDELLVNKKHATVLESWDVRQQRTADFIESILVFNNDVSSIRSVQHIDEPGPNGKIVKVTYTDAKNGSKIAINYTRISDPFGPTITDESISALVISAETRAGGKAVNDKRTEKGWAPLEVFEVDVLDAGSDDMEQDAKVEKTTFESKISSTEIRRRLAAAKQPTAAL